LIVLADTSGLPGKEIVNRPSFDVNGLNSDESAAIARPAASASSRPRIVRKAHMDLLLKRFEFGRSSYHIIIAD
jgi:hypothetical protein